MQPQIKFTLAPPNQHLSRQQAHTGGAVHDRTRPAHLRAVPHWQAAPQDDTSTQGERVRPRRVY